MTTATIAVKGSASEDFPADYATAFFGYEFKAAARSEALAGGNAVIAQLRETVARIGSGAREMKVQSLRVQEVFDHVGPDHIREQTGWAAQLGGWILIEAATVPAGVAQLIRTGVRITHLTWHLDLDTELKAHRAVRRLAVADAREAANDFALALDADLGRLITLADPGLLGAGDFEVGGVRSARYSASATSGAAWDEYVDLDPEEITIWANVEASYEVTLKKV
jgi:uncharacterized protein YggE